MVGEIARQFLNGPDHLLAPKCVVLFLPVFIVFLAFERSPYQTLIYLISESTRIKPSNKRCDVTIFSFSSFIQPIDSVTKSFNILYIQNIFFKKSVKLICYKTVISLKKQ